MIFVLFQIVYAQLKASEKVSYTIANKIARPDQQMFFTEGLSFLDDNTLLESTGLYGGSEIHYISNFWEQPKLESRR